MTTEQQLNPIIQELTYLIVHEDESKENPMLVSFNIVPVNKEKYGINEDNTDYAVFFGVRKTDLETYSELFSPDAKEYFQNCFASLEPKTPYNTMNSDFNNTGLTRFGVRCYFQLTDEQMELFKPSYSEGFQAGAFAIIEEDFSNVFRIELFDEVDEWILSKKIA